jgi:hypothetical protein
MDARLSIGSFRGRSVIDRRRARGGGPRAGQSEMSRPRQRLLFGITVWGMLVTLLRSIRLPNDYAEAHWLIDYRFGFVRRGLIGTVFSAFSRFTHLPQTALSIAVLSVAALAIFCAVLLLAAYRIMTRLDWDGDSLLLANVFMTSPFIVMSAHVIGYYDNITIVLTFCAVWLITRDHPWGAALVQVIAVLIHEGYLLLGLPACVLASSLISTSKRRRVSAARLILPLCLPILAFAALTLYQAANIDLADLQTRLTARLASFGFIQHGRAALAPKWIFAGLSDLWLRQKPLLMSRVANRQLIIAVAPSAVVILCFVFRKFRIRPLSLESTLIAGVTLAPLAMHVIAWDTARIWTYVIVCAFCVAWLYAEIGARAARVKRSWFWLLAIPTLILNILGRLPLMDGESERFTNPERLLLYAPVLVGSFAAMRFRESGS